VAAVPIEIFFKAYPILDANLPPTIKVPSTTEHQRQACLVGEWEAGSLRFFHLPGAHRWLQTAKPGLVLQPLPLDPGEGVD